MGEQSVPSLGEQPGLCEVRAVPSVVEHCASRVSEYRWSGVGEQRGRDRSAKSAPDRLAGLGRSLDPFPKEVA